MICSEHVQDSPIGMYFFEAIILGHVLNLIIDNDWTVLSEKIEELTSELGALRTSEEHSRIRLA